MSFFIPTVVFPTMTLSREPTLLQIMESPGGFKNGDLAEDVKNNFSDFIASIFIYQSTLVGKTLMYHVSVDCYV